MIPILLLLSCAIPDPSAPATGEGCRRCDLTGANQVRIEAGLTAAERHAVPRADVEVDLSQIGIVD